MDLPRLDTLPPLQRQLWPELAAVSQEAFVLYGGTAIALYLGHRESVDFDFFTDRTFEAEDLFSKFHFLRGAEFLQSQRVEAKDYLDIDALLQNGMELGRGCAGARALFPTFAPQECLKTLTYFHESALTSLSMSLRHRLLNATGAVRSVPHVSIKGKALSKR